MKIQCDVCNIQQASVFCTADEAALCDACDHRVHHANKLASKHQRFSLNHPSQKHFPLCDICQERRALVFCQQDRAILCKECDFPIHAANEHTKKHDRFLLTGIKLSAAATLYSSPSSPSNSKPQKNPAFDSSEALMAKTKTCPSTAASTPPPPATTIDKGGGFTSSSISEYLINTIPGWQFEDFLDSHSVPSPASAFSKNGDGDVCDIDGNQVSLWGGNYMGGSGMWVPEAPPSSLYSMVHQQRETNSRTSGFGDDNNFIVPQMSPPNPNINATKRSRLLW